MICNSVTSTIAPLKTSKGKERQESGQSAAGKSVKTQTCEPTTEIIILAKVDCQYIYMYSIYFLLVMAQRHMLMCILPSVFKKLMCSAPLNTKKEHACVVIHHTKKIERSQIQQTSAEDSCFPLEFCKIPFIRRQLTGKPQAVIFSPAGCSKGTG